MAKDKRQGPRRGEYCGRPSRQARLRTDGRIKNFADGPSGRMHRRLPAVLPPPPFPFAPKAQSHWQSFHRAAPPSRRGGMLAHSPFSKYLSTLSRPSSPSTITPKEPSFWMERLLEETSHPRNAGQTLERDVLEMRSSSLENLRVSFLRALRVLRRRQRKKESGRGCSMGGRSLSDQHSGQSPARRAKRSRNEGKCKALHALCRHTAAKGLAALPPKTRERTSFTLYQSGSRFSVASRKFPSHMVARKRDPPIALSTGRVALPRDLVAGKRLGSHGKT